MDSRQWHSNCEYIRRRSEKHDITPFKGESNDYRVNHYCDRACFGRRRLGLHPLAQVVKGLLGHQSFKWIPTTSSVNRHEKSEESKSRIVFLKSMRALQRASREIMGAYTLADFS
jgi:hypothetical protein